MSNLTNRNNAIISVLVYLERKKTRSYVGKLMSEIKEGETTFCFEYDLQYLKRKYAIPLGPELALTGEKYKSNNLFPSFQDRIPSRENPAYSDYCKEAGISEQEQNPIILLVTVGKRGPSSFIFEQEYKKQFSADDLKKYRETLGLTIREFAALFKISASHLQKIESKQFPGKEILRLIAIYKKFPRIVLEEIKGSGKAIHTNKYQKILDLLQNKKSLSMVSKELGPWSDVLTKDEVEHTLNLVEKLKKVSWSKDFLNNDKIRRSISWTEGYELFIKMIDEKPKIDELDPKDIPMLMKTNNGEIWVYGKDHIGKPQLTQLDKRKCNIEFSNTPYKKTISMKPPKPEIYFSLNGQHHNHFNKDEVVNIKSCFFEIRFTYAIHAAGLKAEYEFKTGINKKSIDFKIFGTKTKNQFLIELTSLRDSAAIKENTHKSGNFDVFLSTSMNSNQENSPEVREIIKVQYAILQKTKKFPEITLGSYHIIIVDMRGFLTGSSDVVDYFHILNGGENLRDEDKRYFTSDNMRNLIKGVFEKSYPNQEAREKIHALGFVLEGKYTENEMKSKTKLFINPSLVTDNNEKKLLTKLFEEW